MGELGNVYTNSVNELIFAHRHSCFVCSSAWFYESSDNKNQSDVGNPFVSHCITYIAGYLYYIENTSINKVVLWTRAMGYVVNCNDCKSRNSDYTSPWSADIYNYAHRLCQRVYKAADILFYTSIL